MIFFQLFSYAFAFWGVAAASNGKGEEGAVPECMLRWPGLKGRGSAVGHEAVGVLACWGVMRLRAAFPGAVIGA